MEGCMSIRTWTKDRPRLTWVVRSEASGAPLDITGGVLVALLKPKGGAAIALDAAIDDAAAGLFGVTFPPADTLPSDIHALQVRLTLAGQTNTVVAETVRVEQGF
jgi:hypothetical protein